MSNYPLQSSKQANNNNPYMYQPKDSGSFGLRKSSNQYSSDKLQYVIGNNTEYIP